MASSKIRYGLKVEVPLPFERAVERTLAIHRWLTRRCRRSGTLARMERVLTGVAQTP